MKPWNKRRPAAWWQRPLRWLRWIWGAPRLAYRNIKWFCQRGARGWADCDIWSLDAYLAGWLPGALQRLQQQKQGTPTTMFLQADLDNMERGGDGDADAAAERWRTTLNQMIAAFEAFDRMLGCYEAELGPYPVGAGPVTELRVANNKARYARDERIWKAGAALFIEHFGSLWD